MPLGRADRIILGSCIPPFLGGLIFYVYMSIITTTPSFSPEYNESPFIHFFAGIFYVPIISFVLFGIQSFFYSLLMEFVVQKINNDILVFFISMMLGALIVSFLGLHAQIIGGVVGLIVGFSLRRHIKVKTS